MEEWVGRMREIELPERTELILMIAPGCMFGFPPPNLDAIIDRVDCTTCRAIMEIVARASERDVARTREIDAYCRSARERNAARQRRYAWWRGISILGRIVRPPRLEQDPDYTAQPWYTEAKRWFDERRQEIEALSDADKEHWENPEKRALSRMVVSRLIASGSTYSFPLS